MNYSVKGLSAKEVNESRVKYGSNEISPYELASFWSKLVENLKDPIIIILGVALVVILLFSFLGLTEWYEAVAIGIAMALATSVSTFSEFKNESSFQKLQEEASKITNLVIRESHVVKIPVGEIVVSDFVFLQAGDKIPADGYLHLGGIKVNQSSLTGESESVKKTPAPEGHQMTEVNFSSPHDVWRGSVVDEGEGIMVVKSVGDGSFYGKLAKDLSSADDRLSPLQVKLAGLARLISRFGYIAAILIFIGFTFSKAVVLNGFDPELISAYFSNVEQLVPDLLDAMVLAIIIVVAAVPEGLPMMIAIVLSLNMRKLLMEKVLVRKLLGIETAGSLNILFSDKTGTLTKGKLEASRFISGGLESFKKFEEIPEHSRLLLGLCIMENTSAYISEDGEIVGGNASERALIKYVNEDERTRLKKLGVQEVNDILFDSKRKFSATQIHCKTIVPGIESSNMTLIKGAPEVILERSRHYFKGDEKVPFTDQQEINDHLDSLADQGIRLIALGISPEPIDNEESIPGDITLVGIIGIRDDIREESFTSIEEVQKAGIQVVMITGDRKGTAASIAREIHLLQDDSDVVLVSSELNEKSDEELEKILPNIRVIARALPTDKSRLVRLSKRAGKVVGMTGDGVNDSAALKQADVGIAMGSGSEVSKEAGDIVILDDNFHSINNAIRYGRTIFKSIRKFVVFQLSINVAAVTTALIGPLIGIDFPLTIIQLLWINMIMDTLGAIAFGGEPALHRYLREPPVNRDENILTADMKSSILTSGLYITSFSVFFLTWSGMPDLFMRDGVPNEAAFLTGFFNLFIFMIIMNAFNVRTEKINLLDHIKENKKFLMVMGIIAILQISFTYIGGTLLRTTGLLLSEWLIIIALAFTIIPIDMVRKLIFKSISKPATAINS